MTADQLNSNYYWTKKKKRKKQMEWQTWIGENQYHRHYCIYLRVWPDKWMHKDI